MRRGLIAWSPEEVPPETLDARVRRLQSAMRANDLGAVLIHTCFPRPAGVSFLTQFVPYWSEALLVVVPDGPPTLLAALTKRVHGWIREVSHIGDIVSAPDLGRAAAAYLKDRMQSSNGARIGVVELGSVPRALAEPVAAALGADALVDATAMFATLRQPADQAEIALAERATGIAAKSVALFAEQNGRAGDKVSAAERAARAAGAEEVAVLVALDLAQGTVFRWLEGETTIGRRHAVQISIAYKGTWVRRGQSFSLDGRDPPAWTAADQWLARAIPILEAGRLDLWPSTESTAPPGTVTGWMLEACVGTAPLSVAAMQGKGVLRPLPPGSLANLTVRMQTSDGPWVRSLPLILGGQGTTTRPLAPIFLGTPP